MLSIAHVLFIGLLTQTEPGASPESQKSQEFQEQQLELSFKLSADGHVELTIRERDKTTGKMTEKSYKANSIEEFKKQYPDVAKRYPLDRFGSAGPLPVPGRDDFAKSFEEWKKRFDDRWFWDQHREGGLEKWLEDLPKSSQTEELEKWLSEQHQLFEKFRGIEPPPSGHLGKAEQHPSSSHVLGVLVAPVGETLASQLGLDKGYGVVIVAVQKGSSAEKAGLQPNDVAFRMGGRTISDVDFFRKEVRSSSAPFDLEIIRKGKHQKLKVEAGRSEDKSSD
jgi:hypothetical protein